MTARSHFRCARPSAVPGRKTVSVGSALSLLDHQRARPPRGRRSASFAKRSVGARREGPYQWHFVEHHVAHAASAFFASPFPSAAILTLDGRGESATTTYGRGMRTSMELFGEVDMPSSLDLLYEEVTSHLGFLHSSDEYKVMALAFIWSAHLSRRVPRQHSFGNKRSVHDHTTAVDGAVRTAYVRAADHSSSGTMMWLARCRLPSNSPSLS